MSVDTIAHIYRPQSKEDAIKVAQDLILDYFFADEDELFIDLDQGARFNEKVFRELKRNGITVLKQLTTTSRGGRGKHVYLKLNRPISHHQACGLEVALGGDPTLGMLGLVSRDYRVLFETATEAKKVKEWRG